MREAACEEGRSQHDELLGAQSLTCGKAMARRDAGPGGRRGQCWRTAQQQRGWQKDRPGDKPDHELRGAPVIAGKQQPLREGGDGHRCHAKAGRDEGDGERAMAVEPAAGRRHHGREEGADRHPRNRP